MLGMWPSMLTPFQQVDKGGRLMPQTAVAADPQRRGGEKARRGGGMGPRRGRLTAPVGANAELPQRSFHSATGEPFVGAAVFTFGLSRVKS